jgi:hypothetical protein
MSLSKPIIAHLSIYCPRPLFPALKEFYTAILLPLNIIQKTSTDNLVGFGFAEGGEPDFEIFVDDSDPTNNNTGKNSGVAVKVVERRFHFAFISPTRAGVREFYKAGMERGGTSNGEPGLRRHYHENYYAAFLGDLLGNRIEAVCQVGVDMAGE